MNKKQFVKGLSKLRIIRNLFEHNFRTFVTGSALGISFTLLSFLIYISGYTEAEDLRIHETALNTFMGVWDLHRNYDFQWSIFIKSFSCGLIFLILEAVCFVRERRLNPLILSISFTILLSSLIYLAPLQTVSYSLAELSKTIIPGRFMVLNGIFIFIGLLKYCIFANNRWKVDPKHVSFIFFGLVLLFLIISINLDFRPFLSADLKHNLISLFLMVFLPIIIYFSFEVMLHLKKSFKLFDPDYFIKSLSVVSTIALFLFTFNNKEILFKGTDCDSYIPSGPVLIATSGELKNILRKCKLPIILDPKNLDMITYIPHKADELEKIITLGYGINFSDPPEELKYRASLLTNDDREYHKDIWESRSKEEWFSLNESLNITEIAAPVSWRINLTRTALYGNSALYFLKD